MHASLAHHLYFGVKPTYCNPSIRGGILLQRAILGSSQRVSNKCTAGYILKDNAHNFFVLTAGSCVVGGQSERVLWGTYTPLTKRQKGQHEDREKVEVIGYNDPNKSLYHQSGDYAMIKIDDTRYWRPRGAIFVNYAQQLRKIHKKGDSTMLKNLCFAGVSGLQCGENTGKKQNQKVYTHIPNRTLTMKNVGAIIAHRGNDALNYYHEDRGAPVYNDALNTVVGIVIGHSGYDSRQTQRFIYYQPIKDISDKTGLTLLDN